MEKTIVTAPELESILRLYSLRLNLNALEANRDVDESSWEFLMKSVLKDEISRIEIQFESLKDDWASPDSASLSDMQFGRFSYPDYT